jgi:phosphatidylglycerol:prolipoprotein diacylglycerol transferase
MSFEPLGIHITFLNLTIRYYGIILMSAALLIAWVAEILARRRNFDPEIVWDMFLWIVVGCVVGARIWHILTPPDSMVEAGMNTAYYLTHPFDAINLTRGGLGFPGAVIGGALAMYIYCRRNKLSFLVWGDIAVPGIALGHAFGRLGNWVNHEVYGAPAPATLPWAIYIPPEYRLPEFMGYDLYHPLFLYEMILNIVNFAILIVVGQKYREQLKLKDGDLILLYLFNYGVIRFFLEFLRLDTSPVLGININQVVAATTAVLSVLVLIWRHGLGDWIDAHRPTKEPSTI